MLEVINNFQSSGRFGFGDKYRCGDNAEESTLSAA